MLQIILHTLKRIQEALRPSAEPVLGLSLVTDHPIFIFNSLLVERVTLLSSRKELYLGVKNSPINPYLDKGHVCIATAAIP